MVYQLPALTKVTGFCMRLSNNLNEIIKYEGKLGHYFLGKKTATDISDLAPEVCQRRLVLKRLQQASDKKKSLLSPPKHKLCTVRTCLLCAYLYCVDSRANVQCTSRYVQELLYLQKLEGCSVWLPIG